MDRNDKFGFTLVELLAVIVILAIILVIAVPKVMSVIEDAKKATLESTAKMIASAAEKAKVQNTVLNKNEEIDCEDVVKLNNVDYERCIIEVADDTIKVSIKGSGKFEGLNVCEGDKTNAAATDTSCSVEYGNGAAYISKLQAFNGTTNGLIVDTTADKNIRYVGSNPSNKIYFNCKDVDSNNIIYGEENYDYANSCEIWRIIGVFEVDNGSGKIEKRVKLVRDAFTDSNGNQINMSFDSSSNDINSGYGINQWGESTYEDGSIYEGSDLMQMLNGYYIGEENAACRYCTDLNQGTCENDCSSSITLLTNTSLSMIGDALWKLGSQRYIDTMPVTTMYNNERGTQSGKICEVTSTDNNGDKLCTDTVNRTNEWLGKIGLIYASDYGYASTNESCLSDILGEDSICENDNWLYPEIWYFTLSLTATTARSNNVWVVQNTYNINNGSVSYAGGVRPALYLASNVQIIGGNGDTVPYKLGI